MATTQPPNQNIPVLIDTLNFRVTLIDAYSRGRAPQQAKCHSATGFFYRHNNDTYLITNRHVVISEDEEKYPDILRIKVHTSRTSLIPTRFIEIPLYDGVNRLWMEHPDNVRILDQREKIDLIAIKINDVLQNTDVADFFTSADLPRDDLLLGLGDACIIAGYPYTFHDTTHYLPVVRSGTIASTWRAFFRGKKHFLVDSKLHPGTSGSPVEIPRTSMRLDIRGGVGIGSFPPVLIGVNSGAFVELDLNIVWYSSLIPEILNTPQPVAQPPDATTPP
jgi:hypothetical protein